MSLTPPPFGRVAEKCCFSAPHHFPQVHWIECCIAVTVGEVGWYWAARAGADQDGETAVLDLLDLVLGQLGLIAAGEAEGVEPLASGVPAHTACINTCPPTPSPFTLCSRAEEAKVLSTEGGLKHTFSQNILRLGPGFASYQFTNCRFCKA